MRYRRLGRTALQVSEVCLGTMNFGPTTSEPESFAILDRALAHGVNFVDTANQYGGKHRGGRHRDHHRQLARTGRRPPRAESCWRRSCTSRCRTGPTIAGCRLGTSGWRAMPVCVDCRPTTSTCTKCIISTGPRRGTKCGRPWRPSWHRARSPTSAPATSPAGPSRRPTRRRAPVTFSGWCPNRACTT